MSPEITPEQEEQFLKWLANKEARKVNSTAKRQAMAELRKAHAPEYKKLVKQFGGTTRD